MLEYKRGRALMLDGRPVPPLVRPTPPAAAPVGKDHERYCEVPWRCVPAEVRALAEDVKARCCAALGLGPIRIAWFRPEGAAEERDRKAGGEVWWESMTWRKGVYGMTLLHDPATIWVRTGQDVRNLTYVVAHELHHQHTNAAKGYRPDGDPAAEEQAADEYARAVVAWYEAVTGT